LEEKSCQYGMFLFIYFAPLGEMKSWGRYWEDGMEHMGRRWGGDVEMWRCGGVWEEMGRWRDHNLTYFFP
jgi:hypothetical protein